MSDEINQLKALLGYWLEHNQEHAEEFLEWADKIPAQQKEVAGLLKQAVAKMAESNDYLKKAKDIIDNVK